MSPLAKFFVVLVTVLNVLFLGVSATLYQTQDNWREAAEKAAAAGQKHLADTKDVIASRDGTIDSQSQNIGNAKLDNTRLSTANDGYKQQVSDQKARIDRGEARITELQGSIRQKDTHIQQKDAAIAQLTESNEDFRSAEQAASEASSRDKQLMSSAILDKQQLEEQLETSNIELASYREKHDELHMTLSRIETLQPGISDLAVGARLTKPVDGAVVDVELEEGIVVLSVGSQDGVQVGDPFTIYDGGRFVAKVQVVRTAADLSGCKILFTAEEQAVKAGDSATSRFNF